MKQEPYDFVLELLEESGCEGISEHDGEIRCKCPFHGGVNKLSFEVVFKKEEPFYYCWSCSESGNLVDLCAYLTHSSLRKARRLVEKNTTIGLCDIATLAKKYEKIKKSFSEYTKADIELPPKADNQEPMLEYMEKRAKKYHGILRTEYIVNKYGLYYCASGWYAGRIIMPIYVDGKLIAVNDRSINENLREKSLHQRGVNFGSIIYGLQQAVGKPTALIVEGAFDCFQVASIISRKRKYAERYGIVVVMGCDLTDEKVSIIADNFEDAAILLDHDKAGIAGGRDAHYKLNIMMKTRNLTEVIPKGKDPGKCTDEDILTALDSLGYVPESYLSKLANQWKR